MVAVWHSTHWHHFQCKSPQDSLLKNESNGLLNSNYPSFLLCIPTTISIWETVFLSIRTRRPSAASHKTCVADPLLALFPFSGHAPGLQFFSCSEGPKPEHSNWGVASPVPSTERQSPGPTRTISDSSQDTLVFLATRAHYWQIFNACLIR